MLALKQYDAKAAVLVPEAPTPIRRESVIYNGFYTLTFPDGSHKTFRIFTKPEKAKFAPGRRLIAMLIGPDNTSDYDAFGFVGDNCIDVWKKRRGTVSNPSKLEAYASFIWNLATGGTLDGYSLIVSRRCLRCNRTLTDPESIERGIGPYCDSVME